MVEQIIDNVWLLRIGLPSNSLHHVNSYIIKGNNKGRNLLIDTGIRCKESQQDLIKGMKELNIEVENTDVFITHLHSDHNGNAAFLANMGARIITGEVDDRFHKSDYRSKYIERAQYGGMPEDLINEAFTANPAIIYGPLPYLANHVSDGQIISYGGHELKCILTAGHSPGHMCLYSEELKLMFLGDHVLYGISPIIMFMPHGENILGSYLDSLAKIKQYAIDMPLPAHGYAKASTLNCRIDELISHHITRATDMVGYVSKKEYQTAYEISSQQSWNTHGIKWRDYSAVQKWFALSETIAHLDYLEVNGLLAHCVDKETGTWKYNISKI